MRSFAFATLVVLVLSGCASKGDGVPDPVQPGPGAEPGPRLADGSLAPLNLTYTDCSEQIGVLPLPMESAGSAIPEGFTPTPFDEAGLSAAIVVVAYACTADGAPVNEMTIGLQVEPPAELASADARMHIMVFAALTDRPERAAVLQAWGLANALVGEVEVGLDPALPGGVRIGRAAGTQDGETLEMATTVPAAGEPEAAGFARLFYVDANQEAVTGLVDFHWTASDAGSGTGTARISEPGTTPIMPFLEAGAGIAFHYWGGYDYEARYVPLP